MSKKVTFFLTIATLFNLTGYADFAYANACTSINSTVEKLMSRDQITGIAIVIIHNNKTDFCNYGYANKITKQPITNKSIFEIASLTKTFTALLAGIAVSEGKLNLQAPITDYIPELVTNPAYTKIDVHELLAHVSGLPMMFNGPLTEQGLIDSAINIKFTTPPGTYYQYSNPAFALVGLALTRIYKTDFQNLLSSLVLNKLGMVYTGINVTPHYQNLVVTGYNKNNQARGFMKLGIENSAGGLKSNTYDLAKYLQLQMNTTDPTFQQPLAIVHKNYYCLYEDGTYQQLAWEYHPIKELAKKYLPNAENQNISPPHSLPQTCKVASDGFIDKTGNSPGMTSYIGYIPNEKVGVAILASRALQPDVVNLGRYILQKAQVNKITTQ